MRVEEPTCSPLSKHSRRDRRRKRERKRESLPLIIVTISYVNMILCIQVLGVFGISARRSWRSATRISMNSNTKHEIQRHQTRHDYDLPVNHTNLPRLRYRPYPRGRYLPPRGRPWPYGSDPCCLHALIPCCVKVWCAGIPTGGWLLHARACNQLLHFGPSILKHLPCSCF